MSIKTEDYKRKSLADKKVSKCGGGHETEKGKMSGLERRRGKKKM